MSARRDYGLFGRSSSPPPSSMKGTVISPEKGTEYGKNWTLITLSTLAESARNDTRAWNRTEPQAPKEPEFKGEGQTSPCILIDNALGGSGAGALYLWRSPWVLEGAPGFEVREGRPTAAAMWFGRGCEGVPDQVGSLPVLEMDVCLRAAGGFEVRNRVLWEKGGGGEAGGGKESMWKPVWWSDFIRRKKEPDRSRQGWRSVRIWYGSSRVTEDRFWGEGTISLREEFVKMKGRIGIEVGEEEGWVGDEW